MQDNRPTRRLIGVILELRSAHFDPKLGSAKGWQQNLCPGLKDAFKDNPNFFDKIITGDESLCYAYNQESKQ